MILVAPGLKVCLLQAITRALRWTKCTASRARWRASTRARWATSSLRCTTGCPSATVSTKECSWVVSRHNTSTFFLLFLVKETSGISIFRNYSGSFLNKKKTWITEVPYSLLNTSTIIANNSTIIILLSLLSSISFGYFTSLREAATPHSTCFLMLVQVAGFTRLLYIVFFIYVFGIVSM